MKNKFTKRPKSVKIWMITSSILLIVSIAISIVLKSVPIISNSLNLVFGGERANVVEDYRDELYDREYKNKEEALKAAQEFVVDVEEEGITLLKNLTLQNGKKSLPLSKKAKVSVFGKNSVNLVYGGSGSAGNSKASFKTLYESLTEAGIEYNEELKKFYETSSRSGSGRPSNPDMQSGKRLSGFCTGETPISSYDAAVRNSYASYNDAALVVISRIGGEGFDLPRTMETSFGSGVPVEGATNASDHYLELDANEKAMIEEAKANFENVVVVLNVGTTVEIGNLKDDDGISAILWIGLPGSTGVTAVGEILIGETSEGEKISPSGKTVDTWTRDFTKDPTWYNTGTYGSEYGNRYLTEDGSSTDYAFVNYEEGIYVGYRYYETRGYEEYTASGNYDWYDESVVYPFGYGLSYTQFQWSITPVKTLGIITENDVLKFEVTVKNIGDFAGKDVVQLYYTAPYYEGEIEKAHVVLGDFVKTPIIAAGESLSFPVELSISVQDMASYDYADANNNGFKGYELDDGDYVISIARNAHDIVGSYTYKLETEVTVSQTENADGKLVDVINRFDDVSAGIFGDKTYSDYTSRSNFATTVATKYLTDSERTLTAVLKTVLDNSSTKRTYKGSDEGMPWKVDGEAPSTTPVDSKLSLRDMLNDSGTGEYVGKVDYDDARWETLLNELSLDDMKLLVGYGAFRTVAIEGINGSVSKPLTNDGDGPSGFTSFISEGGAVYDTCFYQAECVMGATWNVELAQRMGELIGEEGLAGNERGDGLPYSGWYAPAVNIHRSPFGGRNWEYYSEDGLLSGKLAAKVCLGAQSKGVYTYVKHFAVNDQETDREMNGILVWCNEQAMRELYLKPFEITVKEGKTSAMMSSFNRLGMTWAGGSYSLLTEILREEWGFKGMVITDYSMNRYTYSDQMIRAGGDLFLTQDPKSFNCSDDATQITLLRKAAKNVLYTVANSNAMSVKVDGYKQPLWQSVMIIIDVAIFLICSLWGVLVILKSRKNLKK